MYKCVTFQVDSSLTVLFPASVLGRLGSLYPVTHRKAFLLTPHAYVHGGRVYIKWHQSMAQERKRMTDHNERVLETRAEGVGV
jgi:hypothetical protein